MKIKLKQAIIVNTDLEMGKGKLAAQVAHAAVQAAENIRLHMPEWYNEWLYVESVQSKIIMKTNSEVKLHPISTEAVSQGIKYPAEIYDADKTQIKPNSFTTLGIGPALYYKIDPLVKDLKYL